MKLLFSVLFSVIASTVGLSAATLDFSGVAGVHRGAVVVPGASIAHGAAGSIVVGVGAGGQTDGFCFMLATSCRGSGEINFDTEIQNLSFDIDSASSGDFVTIRAFHGTTQLYARAYARNAVVDFSALGLITRLTFHDTSTVAGMGVAFSTFTFDFPPEPEPEPIDIIPLPASGGMLFAGLVMCGVLRRRQRP